MRWVLGIDTSNYTTSVAALEFDQGRVAVQARRLLPVKHGERGLRQAEALFFHVQRLPLLMDELRAQLVPLDRDVYWAAIGVSVRPRPWADSYMPVFSAGWSFATAFARACGLPVVTTSHQENHLAAAEFALEELAAAGERPLSPRSTAFFAVHLSGGTSDLVLAERTRFGYKVTRIGEGLDLHAGQFVDRVGVALGLPFPAGPQLEQLAATAERAWPLPSRVVDGRMSFSGPCSAALRAIVEGAPPAEVAAGVQVCIANTLVKAITYAHQQYPTVSRCLVAGGVASNQAVKARVQHRLRIVAPNLAVEFAPQQYARDNAIGCAWLARAFVNSEGA
jgi:N6-L-threonylcarbamoyladenine synthase